MTPRRSDGGRGWWKQGSLNVFGSGWQAGWRRRHTLLKLDHLLLSSAHSSISVILSIPIPLILPHIFSPSHRASARPPPDLYCCAQLSSSFPPASQLNGRAAPADSTDPSPKRPRSDRREGSTVLHAGQYLRAIRPRSRSRSGMSMRHPLAMPKLQPADGGLPLGAARRWAVKAVDECKAADGDARTVYVCLTRP